MGNRLSRRKIKKSQDQEEAQLYKNCKKSWLFKEWGQKVLQKYEETGDVEDLSRSGREVFEERSENMSKKKQKRKVRTRNCT